MHHYSDIDALSFNSIKKPGGVEKYGYSELPMVYDVNAVKVAIRNILMWRVGESVLRPRFGHNLKRSMYNQMTQFNQDSICEEIKRAIEENEPRVQIRTISVKPDEDNNALGVRVVYVVVGDKTSDAEIVEETTIVGK